ncbi:MAG: helix-turn-helix transcriptional regulator [Erysipelotrichaceae bacterium]|nr:helix-turn-helix transcriptional regulator [Erysipelotrichaceae bacterium]
MSELTKKLNNPLFKQGTIFSLCFFLFQLIEFTVNDRAGYVLGADAVDCVYSIGIAFTAFGLLSYPLLKKVLTDKSLKVFNLISVLLVLICSAFMLQSTNNSLFLFSAFSALFFMGNLSGRVYEETAFSLNTNKHKGLIIGSSMSIAVLLQYLVQNYLNKDLYVLCILFGLMFMIKPNTSKTEEGNQTLLEYKDELITIGIATVLMTMLISLIDGVVVQMHALGTLSVSSYSRLFYALSLLIAGYIADIKNRKYLSLITVCVLFASSISTAFISSPNTYFAATSFMYLYSGFYVIYFTITFMDIAVRLNNCSLWAGMGRVIRSLVTAFMVIPTVIIYKEFGTISLIIGSCILSVLILLILLKPISSSLYSFDNEGHHELFIDENIRDYGDNYHLTDREIEVLGKLLTTEDGVQEIADSLFISRRVLQRYISSIYEKTSTKSRIGLFKSFTEYSK